MIMIRSLILKTQSYKEGDMIQCHTQEDSITTNMKVKIYFTSP